jgi:hypothetical protein
MDALTPEVVAADNRAEPAITGRRRQWPTSIGVFALYFFIAAIYTQPLLRTSGSHIANDPGDPVLNASVLWWNATTIPLSERWWNPPYFYLTQGVATFTENLLGISVIASPIYWSTGNPLTAYNLAMFLTWPLSAVAAYLLVLLLTDRRDAAFVAGLAYGFSPYRLHEISHLQSLSSYWIAFALLGLHGYVLQRRVGWLLLFGVAWLLQSLSNGYLMLYGAVLIALWLLFFCTTPRSWRTLPAIVTAWVLASLPLLPILLRYRSVHEHYGLSRFLTEPLGFSIPVGTWLQVSAHSWLWRRVMPQGADSNFPGMTAALVVLVTVILALQRWWRGRTERATEPYRRWRLALATATVISVSLILYMFFVVGGGPWSVSIGDVVVFRMSDYRRARLIAVLCGGAWLLLSASRWRWSRRNAFAFYSAATIAMGLFAVGPVLQIGGRLVEPAPYRWLMSLPGFMEVRTPSRFWMLGVLCLSVAAGLAVARISALRRGLRAVVLAAVSVGVLLDGLVIGFPMSDAPSPWPQVEPRHAGSAAPQPLLELPLGPRWDAAATFRSIWHRRPVVNGVSGYDPPHYAPLQEGLNGRDPAMLLALASFGSIDVIVNGADDPGGAWSRYAAGIPGAVQIATDGIRTAYRIPATSPEAPGLGEALSVSAVTTSAPREDAHAIVDGNIRTEWHDLPQRPGQWVQLDLGIVREVGGVTHTLGEFARDFPRVLAIDLSVDGVTWEEAWRAPMAAMSFRASVIAPLETAMRLAFPGRPARFVRLRQLGEHKNYWRITELTIHAPAAAASGDPPSSTF